MSSETSDGRDVPGVERPTGPSASLLTPAPSARTENTAGLVDWFRLAAHPATMRRAALTAFTVGPILIAINHGPAILAGEVTSGRIAQMCLTIFVPYIVSTVSSVSTRRELARSRVE